MASAIQVLILQQDRSKIVKEWWEEEDDDDFSLTLKEWEESSSFWPERLLKNLPEPMEVFLCLHAEFLASGYSPVFLRRVIQQAHKSMWAARVYLVMDKDWLPVRLDPENPAPFAWTETVLKNKVSDILKWSMGSDTSSEASRRSRKRMEKLVAHLPRREWKCLLQTPFALGAEEEFLLSPYLVSSFSKLNNQDCLIMLPEKRDDYMAYIREKVKEASGFNIMIGIIDQLDTPPSDLDTFCRNNGCSLIQFHGPVELFYFLQRLNSLKLSDMDETSATPVRVVKPAFKSHLPQLLITHSYLPSEPHSCLAAANDTWEITAHLNDEARVEIYPAIKCVKLAHILADLGHVLAWIHIGHGDDENGLQQAQDAAFKSAQDWLNSFASYKSSLPLVLFCSCSSAAVAKRFAESGVGVTIGFARKVNKEFCVELTKQVVKAALDSNGSRLAILEAFREGSKVLGTEDRDASPVAFWASH